MSKDAKKLDEWRDEEAVRRAAADGLSIYGWYRRLVIEDARPCVVCGIANRNHHIHLGPFTEGYHEFQPVEDARPPEPEPSEARQRMVKILGAEFLQALGSVAKDRTPEPVDDGLEEIVKAVGPVTYWPRGSSWAAATTERLRTELASRGLAVRPVPSMTEKMLRATFENVHGSVDDRLWWAAVRGFLLGGGKLIGEAG